MLTCVGVVVGPLGFVPKRKDRGHHLFVNSRISTPFSFLVQVFEFSEEEEF